MTHGTYSQHGILRYYFSLWIMQHQSQNCHGSAKNNAFGYTWHCDRNQFFMSLSISVEKWMYKYSFDAIEVFTHIAHIALQKLCTLHSIHGRVHNDDPCKGRFLIAWISYSSGNLIHYWSTSTKRSSPRIAKLIYYSGGVRGGHPSGIMT